MYLRPLRRTPKYGLPVCNLQLRSYSSRNLDFFADFAMRAAYFLKLPAKGPVPLPRIVERWTVPRSNFVHKKSQENFERRTCRRLIQIQDGHPETVQLWLAYLEKRGYHGVGLKANMWEYEKLDLSKRMAEESQEMQNLLDKEVKLPLKDITDGKQQGLKRKIQVLLRHRARKERDTS
jgi:ribosomal protein S10